MEQDVIVHDTRDRPEKHRGVDAYLERAGYRIVRSKLYVGDITFLHDQSICIDIKQDVIELGMDVYQEHRRFRDELIRAQEAGIQLIILVKEELPEGRLDKWVSPVYRSYGKGHRPGDPVSHIDPKHMRKVLMTMQEKYGVKFRFCDGRSAGKRVIEYLRGERQ